MVDGFFWVKLVTDRDMTTSPDLLDENPPAESISIPNCYFSHLMINYIG